MSALSLSSGFSADLLILVSCEQSSVVTTFFKMFIINLTKLIFQSDNDKHAS